VGAALLGYDVQYFAAVEPQKRLAPHVHVAFRGAISRADLRQVIAATYHQVWWPSTATVRYDSDQLPAWHEPTGRYVDPDTGELLPSWDEALDAIGMDDEPVHVARFGPKFDAQGMLAGSRDAKKCIGYLTKYLTKQLGQCHQSGTDAQADHTARLLDALRYEPCSPTCATGSGTASPRRRCGKTGRWCLLSPARSPRYSGCRWLICRPIPTSSAPVGTDGE
jgi:hypothetical protein